MEVNCLPEKPGISLFLLVIFILQIFTPLKLTAQDTRQLQREKSSTSDNKSVEKRTALVIGNSNYATSPLTNPANDATDMAAALKTLDFEVISGVNLSRAEMIRLVRQFGERLKANGGVGLFYYAGHGVQVEGRNYLIPVDAQIRSENEVELEAVDVARTLVEMENAGNALNIVILDACRNNPFSRSWRSTNDGLAQINAPSGTLIAYSTAPGKVASDGAGRNAPYTAALLKAMKTPDLSLSDVFMQVRAEVQRTTNRQQTPWEASSITGKFYFRQTAITDPNKKTEPQTVSDAQIEQEYWDTIKNSQNAADFQAYLKEYPSGRFAALARLRISQYEKTTTDKNPTTTNTSSTNTAKTAGAISKAALPGGIEMRFAYIPAGSFEMGLNTNDNEKPVHTVRISQGFEMQTTEVTQAQWKAVMGALPSKCDYGELSGNFLGENKPVICVSWDDAQEFVRRMNAKTDGYHYRLPTEAEWEYAARAGTTGDYAGNLDSMAWYGSNSGGSTRDVGTKQANGWGLYDMHGNVWEWVNDWYDGDYYAKSPATDPTGPSSGSYRVLRGGGWNNPADYLRSANRSYNPPSDRGSIMGFRLLRQ
jgi:formylglycine-generating enzyme required for sulfatase activity